MTRNNKVPLGKKDGLLRYWWERALSQNINISKAVVAALEYYMLTGAFLELATVKKITTNYEDSVIKWVYVTEDSELYEWLSNRQKNGEKVSTTIKYILRNSLIIGDEDKLKNNDQLYSMVEAVKHSKIISVKAVEEPIIIHEDKIGKTSPKKNDDNKPLQKDIVEESSAGEFNIFEQLLDGKGLNI